MGRPPKAPLPYYVCSCKEKACRESCKLYKGRQEGLKHFRELRAQERKKIKGVKL